MGNIQDRKQLKVHEPIKNTFQVHQPDMQPIEGTTVWFYENHGYLKCDRCEIKMDQRDYVKGFRGCHHMRTVIDYQKNKGKL